MGRVSLAPMRVVTDLSVVWASIPSPGEWGRQYRLYGIMIALGVIAGLELARRRWAARGGNPEDMSSIALWAVPAGLIGARLYHVVTDNELYRGEHWVEQLLAEFLVRGRPESGDPFLHGRQRPEVAGGHAAVPGEDEADDPALAAKASRLRGIGRPTPERDPGGRGATGTQRCGDARQ